MDDIEERVDSFEETTNSPQKVWARSVLCCWFCPAGKTPSIFPGHLRRCEERDMTDDSLREAMKEEVECGYCGRNVTIRDLSRHMSHCSWTVASRGGITGKLRMAGTKRKA